jgi:hypothetical protein
MLIILVVGELLLCSFYLFEVLVVDCTLFKRCKGLTLSNENFFTNIGVLNYQISIETPSTVLTLNPTIVYSLLKVLIQCICIKFTSEPFSLVIKSFLGRQSWSLTLTGTQTDPRMT